jgi:hypothetical protein
MVLIAITSHVARSGKTQVAVELARAFTDAGVNTVLCDLSSSGEAERLGLSNGLSVQRSLAPAPQVEVAIVDAGSLGDGALNVALEDERTRVLYVLPADTEAVASLPVAARDFGARLAPGGRSVVLGFVVARTQDDALARELLQRFGDDMLGLLDGPGSMGVVGESLRERLGLSVAAPKPGPGELASADIPEGGLLELRGLMPTSAPAAKASPASSEYTYVLDSKALASVAQNGSAPLAEHAKASAGFRTPAPGVVPVQAAARAGDAVGPPAAAGNLLWKALPWVVAAAAIGFALLRS